MKFGVLGNIKYLFAESEIKKYSFSEKVVFLTAALTPVWWLLGVQPLFYPTVLLILLIVNLDLNYIVRNPFPAFVWAWLIMLLAACSTMLIGLDQVQASLKTVASTFVTLYKGYFLIFCCAATPFLAKIRSTVVVRGVCWMSIGMLCNLIVQLILLALGVDDYIYVPPLAKAIPGDVSASLLVRSAKFANFFGVPLPRSILHTADPPILGLVGLLCILICSSEENFFFRRLSIFGASSALIISFSRSAWIGLILASSILFAFRLNFIRRAFICAAALVFWLCVAVGVSVKVLAEYPLSVFDSARAESTSTRAIVVKETIEAWQEKIWTGWGIIRGEAWLYEDVYIKLGSFSTYAAVLYLHGIWGFLVFSAALLLTLLELLKYAARNDYSCQIGCSSFLVLCLLLQATPLTWMAIYLWFFFVWLSCILSEARLNSLGS